MHPEQLAVLFELRITYCNKFPECVGMIHLSGVTQFVNKHIIDQFVWELHESDVQTDRATTAATAPSSASMRKPNLLVAIAQLVGQIREAAWQVILGLYTKRRLDCLAYQRCDFWRIEGFIGREAYDNLLAVTIDVKVCAWSNNKGVAFADLHTIAQGLLRLLVFE
jgi:hypothetical protein